MGMKRSCCHCGNEGANCYYHGLQVCRSCYNKIKFREENKEKIKKLVIKTEKEKKAERKKYYEDHKEETKLRVKNWRAKQNG